MPLLRMDSGMKVIDTLSPPELHLIIGDFNLPQEVIYNYLTILGQHGITRRGMFNEILN